MDFTLTKEQELLRDSVAKFLSARYNLEESRAATTTRGGWQPQIWQGFAEDLGILGAVLPTDVGGSGGGPVELMSVTEELGYALVTEPYLETVVIGGGLLQRAGGSQATALLTGIAEGSVRTALAAGEPTSGYSLNDVSTVAQRKGSYWVLTGEKTVVSGAPLSTHLLITARTSGEQRDTAGISLFLLPLDVNNPPQGLKINAFRTIDDRHAADLTFDELRLPIDALLGVEGDSWGSIAQTIDVATAAVASEAVGLIRKVLDDTVEYTRQRRQFEQPIAGFQVLQHRMVDMYMELEQAISAVYLAMLKLGGDPKERAKAVSAAKVTVSRAARFVGQNAVQLHGGMGMTQELAVGHYFKRLTVIEHQFGPADLHIARYAELSAP